jgi:hypothetical protein
MENAQVDRQVGARKWERLRFCLFLRKLICTVSFVGFVYRLSTNVSYDTLSHGGYFQVPVVPHKAVAEVSKIGNL